MKRVSCEGEMFSTCANSSQFSYDRLCRRAERFRIEEHVCLTNSFADLQSSHAILTTLVSPPTASAFRNVVKTAALRR